ncbi:MAG: hypothetical protein SGPRY_007245 [Prymnesium sp.]
MLPCDPHASAAASTLLEGLRRVGASETFLFGHQNTGWSNQNAQSRLLESDVSRATNGDFPAVVGFNLAQIRNRNLRAAVEQALRRGSVLTFSWEAPNPVTGGSSRDVSGNPMRELLPGGSANEKWNEWLDEIAAFFLTIDAPILFRPFHENTAETYWWGRSCSPSDFQAAWRYTQTRLWGLGVHSLLFVYSPAKPDRDYNQAFNARYPGSDAVDIIGFDYYGANDISRGLLSCCTQTARFASFQGKVLAIAEFGVFGGLGNGAGPNWFLDSFSRPVRGDKECARIAYALTWANSVTPPSYYIPLPGQVAYTGFLQFYQSRVALFASGWNSGKFVESLPPTAATIAQPMGTNERATTRSQSSSPVVSPRQGSLGLDRRDMPLSPEEDHMFVINDGIVETMNRDRDKTQIIIVI